ncbi:MAG: YbbR-like domain-containing protein [Desulfobacteraceae bacterium]|nr:MAG: YbbR-like domain-containing protein [Desulfobacteraceae bacterium]
MYKLPRSLSPIFAFLLLGIWCVLVNGCSPVPVEERLLLPVNFSSVPNGFVLTSFYTGNIEIKIKGDPRLIQQINQENIEYPVDLYTDIELDPAGASDSIEPGVYLIPLIKKRIPINPAIEILDLNPTYLSVKLENRVSKKFNVMVPYTGKPATGYIAIEAKTTPTTVLLTGAESVIHAIKTLKTKPLDLNGVTESFKKELPLDIERSLPITPSDPVITASIQIKRKLVARKLEHIPINALNCKGKPTITPNVITVEIKGPYDDVTGKLVEEKVYSYIDLSGLKPGVYARNACINIPVGLIMTDANPEVFTVKIE